MRRSSRVGAVAVAAAALAVALPAVPAAAVVDGVQVQVQGPQQLRSGSPAAALTAVATKNQGSVLDCRRVRWVLDATGANGFAVDDLRVARDENGAPVPLSRSRDGARLRLVDQRADEGVLCRGRAVTARYALAADASAAGGTVDLAVTAFDDAGQPLATGSLRVAVRGQAGAAPTPTPGLDDTAAPPDDATDAGGAPPPTAGDGADPAVPASSSTDIPVAGFAAGGLLLLLGAGLGASLYYRRRGPGGLRGRHEPGPPLATLFGRVAGERPRETYRGRSAGRPPGAAGRLPGLRRRVGDAAAGWTGARRTRRP